MLYNYIFVGLSSSLFFFSGVREGVHEVLGRHQTSRLLLSRKENLCRPNFSGRVNDFNENRGVAGVVETWCWATPSPGSGRVECLPVIEEGTVPCSHRLPLIHSSSLCPVSSSGCLGNTNKTMYRGTFRFVLVMYESWSLVVEMLECVGLTVRPGYDEILRPASHFPAGR